MKKEEVETLLATKKLKEAIVQLSELKMNIALYLNRNVPNYKERFKEIKKELLSISIVDLKDETQSEILETVCIIEVFKEDFNKTMEATIDSLSLSDNDKKAKKKQKILEELSIEDGKKIKIKSLKVNISDFDKLDFHSTRSELIKKALA